MLAQRPPAGGEVGADRGVRLLDGAGGATRGLARKRGDDRGADEEAHAVDGERGGGRAQEQQRGAEERAGDDAQAGDADARGVRGGQVGIVDQSRHHGHDALRVGGAGGGAQRGEHRGEDDRAAGEGDDGERGHRGRPQDVGADHHGPPVVAVGEHAAERSEHDLGQDARRGRDPDPRRRSGALVDEREQREVVEPVAGLGDDQAGEQAAEVALRSATGMAGRGSAGPRSAWSLHGRAGGEVWF